MKIKKCILISCSMVLAGCSTVGNSEVIKDSSSSYEASHQSSEQHSSEEVSSTTSSEQTSVETQKLKLNTPRDLYMENGVLRWDEVPNADGYEVKLEDGEAIVITHNQFAIESFNFKVEKGVRYRFYVKATSKDQDFYDSDWASSSFSINCDKDIEQLFSSSREYASLSDYGSSKETGTTTTDVTEKVRQGLISNEQLSNNGIKTGDTYAGYKAVYKKVDAKMSYDDLSDWTGSNSLYYLGNVVKINADPSTNGETFVTNCSGLSLSHVNLYCSSSMVDTESVRVDNPTASRVSDAVNANFRSEITSMSKLGIISSTNIQEIDSRVSLNYQLGLPAGSKTVPFAISSDTAVTNISIFLKQIYYTISADTITKPYEYINESDDAIREELSKGYCPAYVSSVSYGRIVSIVISIKHNQKSYDDNVNVGGTSTISDIKKYLSVLEEEFPDQSVSYSSFVYGGSSSSEGINLSNAKDFDTVISNLDTTMDYNTALPISYQLTYLDGSGEQARVGSTASYYVKEYIKLVPTGLLVYEEEERLKKINICQKGYSVGSKTGIDLGRVTTNPADATLYKVKYQLIDHDRNDSYVEEIDRLAYVDNDQQKLYVYNYSSNIGKKISVRCYCVDSDGNELQFDKETIIEIALTGYYRVTYYDSASYTPEEGYKKLCTEEVQEGEFSLCSDPELSNKLHDTATGKKNWHHFLTDPDSKTLFDRDHTPITRDMNLYVTWGDVSINYYGFVPGSNKVVSLYQPSSSVLSEIERDDETIYAYACNTPIIEDEMKKYGMDAWNITYYKDIQRSEQLSFPYMVSDSEDDISIYVKFTKKTVSINATASEGGTVIGPNNVEYGDNASYIASESANYKFDGWYDSNNALVSNGNILNLSNVTKDASYSASFKKYRTVTLVDNHKTENIEYFVGDNVDLPTLARRGYEFKGWYLNDTKVSGFAMPDEDLTLKAEWQLIDYAINYNLDGGSFDGEHLTSYNVNSPTSSLPTPVKDHYEFKGWYLDSEFTTPVSEISSGSTGALDVYASWEAEKYLITFNTNGGSPIGDVEVSYSPEAQKILLPETTLQYFDFRSWSVDNLANASVSKEDGKYYLNIKAGNYADIKLTANWPSPINVYFGDAEKPFVMGYGYTYKTPSGGTYVDEFGNAYRVIGWRIRTVDDESIYVAPGGYITFDFTPLDGSNNYHFEAQWELIPDVSA